MIGVVPQAGTHKWKWRMWKWEGVILRPLRCQKCCAQAGPKWGTTRPGITAQLNPLQGSDLTCFVYDPFGVRLRKTLATSCRNVHVPVEHASSARKGRRGAHHCGEWGHLQHHDNGLWACLRGLHFRSAQA